MKVSSLDQHTLSTATGFGIPSPPKIQFFLMACGASEVLDS
jgi:hypothetical protein